jgi:flagellar biosynthetic protein FliP
LSALTVFLLLFLALLFSCYVRLVTVLSIVRTGLGVTSLPTAFVTAGLALALTFFVMYPTLREAGAALDGVAAERGAALSDGDRVVAITRAVAVWRKFLLKHTPEAERSRFAQIALRLDSTQPDNAEALEKRGASWQVLAPAFVTSELKIAFGTGLSLLLPFFIIDLLIATVMTSLGVESLNASLVALPFKLLLFVLVDGWALITTNLVTAYTG